MTANKGQGYFKTKCLAFSYYIKIIAVLFGVFVANGIISIWMHEATPRMEDVMSLYRTSGISNCPNLTEAIKTKTMAGSCPPRKIYIDAGANLANSLYLYNEAQKEPWEGPWEVFAFEATPELAYYTKVVTDALNEGLPIDEAQAKIHWDEKTDKCVQDSYKRLVEAKECGPAVEKWHHEKIAPFSNSGQIPYPENLDTASCSTSGWVAPTRNRFTTFNGAVCGCENMEITMMHSTGNYIDGGSNSKGFSVDHHWKNETVASHHVPCVDLAKWMLENFRKEDYVFLKLDIEGSEYEVMPRLLASEAWGLIDELSCEFHSRFFNDYVKQLEKKLYLLIKKSGVIFHEHG